MQYLKQLSYPLKLLKSTVYSILFAFALLILFSIVIHYTGANDGVIRAINIIIRLLSVGLCVFLSVEKSSGIAKGALAGLATAILLQLCFCFVLTTFNFKDFALGTVFSVIFGIIFGIIFVNLKNKGESSWKK